ncbi:sigma-70 family RNA polymerase sigma factor [Streptomyces sp. I05A-00742]|uniref:sigma-70 family RNA polymerase sigma factor n=1 Tax=Streptomyces sp. I05A-00742 TaxID=2732853 RepID=UPI0028997964|nr:sigma-70 family RNA polymerase sigma factor [Streptomyces sp. I05A-00742]
MSTDNAALVEAARAGDTAAQDELVADCLPLVYNIVGRALNGHADVDDVVQETMLRVINGLGELRDPAGFRSWLVAITTNQIRTHWRERRPETPLEGLPGTGADVPDPAADFVAVTIVRLGLEGQRKEVAEATRWLDAGEREVLSLWWLEAAGELTRAEVAGALGLTPQHTAVRVQRIKDRLDTARGVVRALSATPRCPALAGLVAPWDGVPSALWRKRVARHARGCGRCDGAWSALVPAEGLLVGFGLVPVAGALLGWWGSATVLRTESAVAVTAPPPGGPETSGTSGATADPMHHTHPTHPTHPTSPTHTMHSAKTTKGKHGVTNAKRTNPRAKSKHGTKGKRAAIGAAVLAVVAGGAVIGGSDLFSDSSSGTEASSKVTTGGDAAPLGDRATTADPTPSARPSASAKATKDAKNKADKDGKDGKGEKSAKKGDASESASGKGEAKKERSSSASGSGSQSTTSTRAESRSQETRQSGAASRTPAKRSAKVPAPAAGNPGGSLQQQVTALVNAERAKAGCSPVRANSQLTQAAQGHSDDMAARNFFDHTNPDGKGPGDRVTAAGYRWSTYGENIAYGQQTPASVMDTWMNSSGHRANILNCSFKEIGVGINNAPGGPRWTQVFGAQ